MVGSISSAPVQPAHACLRKSLLRGTAQHAQHGWAWLSTAQHGAAQSAENLAAGINPQPPACAAAWCSAPFKRTEGLAGNS